MPPVPLAVDVVLPPLQLMVPVVRLPVRAVAGSVMLAVLVELHPFASVIVTVYCPAVRLLAVAVEPPVPDHKYV